MPETLEVSEGVYEILGKEDFDGRTYIGIYNDKREQYEVYSERQNPKIVPCGADEYSLNVAFAEVESQINEEIEKLEEELAGEEEIYENDLEDEFPDLFDTQEEYYRHD